MRNMDYIDDTAQDVLELINSGNCVNYGPLSICRLRRFSNRDIQVDCDSKEVCFTYIFDDFAIAFDTFLEVRKRLINVGYIIKFEVPKKKYVEFI